VTLKAGDRWQHSGQTIPHDAMIGRPDGSLITLSGGKRMLAVRPTLAEYVLKMPRGAQVIYPKDLAMITVWADLYPGARVFEAGTGSGSLTMALLRAVGERGSVVSYEAREDFARTALKNIERYLGRPAALTVRHRDAYEGLDAADQSFDRIVLDLPEPWRVIPHIADALRPGGVYLSYVPTVPQVMQTVEALERATVFGLIQTFETLLRTWNVQGRSVRPDHRMVAHSGFITVARKVEPGLWGIGGQAPPSGDMDEMAPPDEQDEDDPGEEER
jgi:tRNA (adenine57-N1/adenine58-N1)-methyltransferase